MEQRNAIVAGQFYPASREESIEELRECLAERNVPKDLAGEIVAGIVPHAGWVFSGSLAGLVFNSVKAVGQNVDTFVLFGAAHSHIDKAMVYDTGVWSTPMGTVEIDEQLAEVVLEKCKGVFANRRAHAYEHSIEVQVPFIQYLFEGAKILPVMVPAAMGAVAVGKGIGEIIKGQTDKKYVCIGSTDLTHYGPRYGFTPEGVGEMGIEWAKEINDKSFIDLAVKMDEEGLLKDALKKMNACGPGAAAATIAAAKEMGAEKGRLLAHTHSNDVMKLKYNQTSEESVGYAAIVF